MRIAIRTLVTLMLAASIAMPLLASDGKEKKKKGKNKAKRTLTVIRVPKTIDLTEEQAKTLAAINKEYGPKFTEAQKKVAGILTAEQRKARGAAFKAGREANLKGKELRAAIQAAVKLTDEQKKAFNDARKAVRAIRVEAFRKFAATLTPEQRQKLRGARKGAGKKKRNPNAKNNDGKNKNNP